MTTEKTIEEQEWSALEPDALLDALVEAYGYHATITKIMNDLQRALDQRVKDRRKVDDIIIGVRSELRSRMGA